MILSENTKPNKAVETQEGVIADIVFRNEQNGYSVCRLSDDSHVVGILPFLHPGESVRFHGRWTTHPDYGVQFQAERYELMTPSSKQAVFHYLSSGLIKGMGEKTARRLTKEFGKDTLKVLRQQPERVAALRGIGPVKADKFARQLQENEAFQELMLLLAPLDVGTGTILRIHRQYGNKAQEVLGQNPYLLADEVHGIGFLTADRLARKLGLEADAPQRVAGAIQYVLVQAAHQGHTAMPFDDCLRQTEALLGFAVSHEHEAVATLRAEQKILLREEIVNQKKQTYCLLPVYYRAEAGGVKALLELLRSAPRHFDNLADRKRIEATVRQACANQDLVLAEEQMEALMQALQHPVSILTGGPGTGKTTIIKLLCDCMQDQGGKIMLAAPTGRAARRMSEASGREAKTLHRLLEIGFSPDGNREASQETAVQLECDLLIVDETSMMDVFLFRNLMEATVPGMRLLFVGDADQLPSVGPGDVLKDLIESDRVPVARLTKIFRQAQESLIIENAHRINQGKMPRVDQSFESQFLLIYKQNADEIAVAVGRLCSEVLPQQYHLDPIEDVQVITPVRKGPAGCHTLNPILQKLLAQNENLLEERTIAAHGYRFGRCDKVMQTRNNYELSWCLAEKRNCKGQGVFNGETGRVLTVNTEDKEIDVLFDEDRLVRYDASAMEDLDLAYAMTVHKSQGSEYPVVVLAIPPGAPQLLTRNLLYTAVTRARQKIFLVTTRRTLQSMIQNDTAYQRHTLMGCWLRQKLDNNLRPEMF